MRVFAAIITTLTLLALPAAADPHRCETRRSSIEARYQELCPFVDRFVDQSGPLTDVQCATYLFEVGIRLLASRVDKMDLEEDIRRSKCELNNRERVELDGLTPENCGSPTPSATPTTTPTAAPTPTP